MRAVKKRLEDQKIETDLIRLVFPEGEHPLY